MIDDDRRAILSRRARLIAAALAGAGLGASACARDATTPATCLSPPPEVTVPSADAGAPEPEHADAALPPRAGPGIEEQPEDPPELGPRICLSEL